jgi:hypothetical protein
LEKTRCFELEKPRRWAESFLLLYYFYYTGWRETTVPTIFLLEVVGAVWVGGGFLELRDLTTFGVWFGEVRVDGKNREGLEVRTL